MIGSVIWLNQLRKWHKIAIGLGVTSIVFLVGSYIFLRTALSALDYNPHDDEYFSDAALNHPPRFVEFRDLPAGWHDLWVFDGGNFSGSIYYASFRCSTLEDCWTSLNLLGAPHKSEFHSDLSSKYAVNLYGPGYYWRTMDSKHWNVTAIKNGAFYEKTNNDYDIEFWALDAETLTVYYHEGTGGFPDDGPDVRYRWPDR